MANEATRPPNKSTELFQKELESHQAEQILDQKAAELRKQLEAINPIPKPAPEPMPKVGASWKIFFLSHLATGSLFLIWHFGMNTFLLCTGGGSLALLSGFGAYKLKKFISKRNAEKTRLAEEAWKEQVRRNAEQQRRTEAEKQAQENKERAEKLELAKNQAPISFEIMLQGGEYSDPILGFIPEFCLIYTGFYTRFHYYKLPQDQFEYILTTCCKAGKLRNGAYATNLYEIAKIRQNKIDEQTKLEQEKLRAQEAIKAAAEEPAIELDEFFKKYPAIKNCYHGEVSNIFEEQSVILITGYTYHKSGHPADKKWLVHLKEESFKFVKMQLALIGFQGVKTVNELIDLWEKSQ